MFNLHPVSFLPVSLHALNCEIILYIITVQEQVVLQLLAAINESQTFGLNVIWILITLLHFLHELNLDVFNWCLIGEIGLDLFIGQHPDLDTFHLRLFWLGFILEIFGHIVFVVIQWVIYASYGQSIACPHLIVCGSDWIAYNLELGILKHFLGSLVVFGACRF